MVIGARWPNLSATELHAPAGDGEDELGGPDLSDRDILGGQDHQGEDLLRRRPAIRQIGTHGTDVAGPTSMPQRVARRPRMLPAMDDPHILLCKLTHCSRRVCSAVTRRTPVRSGGLSPWPPARIAAWAVPDG